jgi:two-component system sensor histidine kinase HydH
MQHLITELARSPDIAYILLADHKGAILNQSGDVSRLNAQSIEALRPDGDGLQTRLQPLADGTKVYELVKPQAFGFIVLGLNMELIEAANEDDFHHAIMMAVIVLALGSSALFFTFVIQRYYGVNRTLHQTQNYTRQVIDSLATGLIRIDVAGAIESYNHTALELLGLSGEAPQGQPLSRYLDVQAIGIAETFSGRRAALEREIGYLSPSGQRLPLAVSASPIVEADGPVSGVVILLRDLREIKTLESKVRRAEKLAAVGELAASVAHEIRNPLSSIKGFAQFLNKGFGDHQPEREYTQIMIQEVDRINAVVNSLLTFARPVDADLQPIDVTKVIAHTLLLVEADAKERSIRIQTRFENETPIVHADSNQLTQALLNLLMNAITAIERNGTITVGIENDRPSGDFRIWVEDDGPGIVPELHEKIFEPFFTNREKGTGLGLAMVRKIIELHNGSVAVISPAPLSGTGTRFVLRLPMGTVSDLQTETMAKS